MSFDSKYFDYNFFVVSSDNCHKMKPRLYGYAIFNGSESSAYNIHINGAKDIVPHGALGTYVNITKISENLLLIQQDYNGGYGLYFCQKDDFFAISNSYLYLLEHLKGKVDLSLNADFAKYFITDELASLSVSETLINEIQLLPKDVEVKIDAKQKTLTFDKVEDDLNIVSLETKEGIDILDSWYHKWQSILMNLQQNNEKVKVDLTGGMDSRATFAIFNNSTVEYKNILVNSSTKKLHTHIEDYEVASTIADRLGFQLNQPVNIDKYPLTLNTAMKSSFYSKLGIHKQLFFKANYSKQRLFYFTGYGGESIRKHWYMSPEEFTQNRLKHNRFVTVDATSSIRNIISRSVKDLEKRYVDSEVSLMRHLYSNTRLRSHFGKNIVENIIGNIYCMNPLMDRELQKVHTNDDTLLAVIYDRYLNELNEVKFERNRKLEPESVVKAKKINKKYPYIRNNKFAIAKVIDETTVVPNEGKVVPQAKQQIMDVFYSDKVKNIVMDMFGYEIYQKAKLNWERGGFCPELLANSLMAIAVSADSINAELGFFDTNQNAKLFSNNELIAEILDVFKLARIDIKNFGNDNNDITFARENLDCKVITPKWFGKKGIGYVIESNAMSLNIKLKCINDGQLKISLKGLHIRDVNTNSLPAYIDYTSFKINGVEKLLEPFTACHDKPKAFSTPVKDGEVVELSFEWKPYGYGIDEFRQLIDSVLEYLPFKKEGNRR